MQYRFKNINTKLCNEHAHRLGKGITSKLHYFMHIPLVKLNVKFQIQNFTGQSI